MTPISCRKAAKVVQSFLDGELDSGQADRVAQHLERCEQCGMDAQRLEQVRIAIAQVRQDPADGAVARVLAKVRAQLR